MNRKWVYLMLALVLALGLTVMVGCGDDDEADDTETTEAAEGTETTEAGMEGETETTEAADMGEADGAQVFADTCSGCHGDDGTGNTGPDLTASTKSQEEVADQVRNGGTSMPAYGDRLNDAEIDAVATYVVDELQQ